jgi:hypothetical protein
MLKEDSFIIVDNFMCWHIHFQRQLNFMNVLQCLIHAALQNTINDAHKHFDDLAHMNLSTDEMMISK